MSNFGVVSYGSAGIGFAFLTLLLVAAWGGSRHGARLILAAAATTTWAVLLAWKSQRGDSADSLVLVAELLRYGAWFAVLAGLLRTAGTRRALLGLLGTWMGALVVLSIAVARQSAGAAAQNAGSALLVPGGIVTALVGLAGVVQVFRRSDAGTRDALGFLLAALGAMFAYDLVVCSAALLGGTLPSTAWDARGFVAATTVPFIAIAAKRNPQWTVHVFVSRYVVFYVTAMLAAGAYLGLVVMGGRLIRQQGGSSGAVLEIVFVAAAATVLLLLAASADLRRRLRVFLSKHFYRSRYDYRAEWLRFIQTLSAQEQGSDPGTNAVRAIAQIIQSPGGVLFLRQTPQASFVPAYAWPQDGSRTQQPAEVAADSEFVQFLERRQWVIDLEELRVAPDMYEFIALPGCLATFARVRFVLPLLHGPTLIGFVLLEAPRLPINPTFEDRDLLKTVGRHVATHIAQHEADRRLAESRQFEAYHRLTAYVMHDLKNLAAQLALIVDNAKRHKRNPEFVDDTIATVANSTQRMQRLIEQLQGREPRDQRRAVPIVEIVRRACARCALGRPAPVVGACDTDALVEADPERLITAFEHVIRNAQDATADEGCVTITVRAEGTTCVVTVADTGCGMTEEFVRERLFKPFDTTKGSQGMGVGAYQLREYVQSLGGAVEVSSAPGRGTSFVVRLDTIGS